MYVADTIVAPATPPGQGAVAIIRLSGPRAIEIANALWHPMASRNAPSANGSGLIPRKLYLGEISDPQTGARIDRSMCVVMRAPKSLTGEEVAEIHCHGGVYLVRRVVALAVALGARMAEPGEFSRRAFLNGRIDLTEAEAIADLVAARGDSALRQALAHLSGALAERVKRLRRQVINIRAHLEAEIDFADEDIKLPSRGQMADEIARLLDDINLLHDSFARGRLMREGARAAIIGKPNAGKSSVLNLLLGVERAIVTAIPGTTRDVIEDAINVGPYPLVVQDTAGMRETSDEVERIGIDRTRQHADAADLLIAIFDSARPFAREDAEVIAMCRGRAGLALLNKCDLPCVLDGATLQARGLDLPVMEFSALTAEGVGPLRDRLAEAVAALADAAGGIGGQDRDNGLAISRERHREALARARQALVAARDGALAAMPPEMIAVDVALAAEALGAITGEVSTEDVLDAVFREFCIGK